MKTKVFLLFISVILISALIFFMFFPSKEEIRAKEYKIEADNDEKSRNGLSKQTLNIEEKVIKKQLLYEEKMAKIESSLKQLEKQKSYRFKQITSRKIIGRIL